VHVYDAKNCSLVRSIGADFGAGPGGLDTPMAVLVNDQHVFVSDYTCHRVQVFRASDGKFVRSLGEGELQNPSGLALDSQGNLYVADTSNNTIRIFHYEAE
jgi:DNA-binding beta-propeller fold protein YncE